MLGTQGGTLASLLEKLVQLLNLAIPILITIAVIFIIWQAINFARATDPSKKGEAQRGLIQGVIGLAVVFSLFGIIRLLQNTVFGGSQTNNPTQQGLQAPKVIF